MSGRVPRRAVVAVLLVAVLAGGARAQGLAALFPEQADVFVPGPGLVRLPLPAAVVTACTPDLADLRLFDHAGREVPYLVDPGTPVGDTRHERRVVDARVLDLRRESLPREDRQPLTREIYTLTFPETPPAGDAWTLVLAAAAPRFVRSLEIRGTAADGTTEVLVPRASIVRLGQSLADRTHVPLPAFDGREIVVTIEGEEGAFLEPVMRYESARALTPGEALAVPLEVRSRQRAGDRTVIDVTRPPGLVPAQLAIVTTTPALDRVVSAWDVAPSGAATPLGSGRLVRAPVAAPAGEAATPAGERLAFEVGPARGERLRLIIEDGDSPPLDAPTVTALVRPPALVFALRPPAADHPAGVLRWGGGRAWRPRYDLAELFRDAAAAGAGRLDDAAALPAARLGAIQPNPAFDAKPALAPVMRAGTPIDERAWRWRRALDVPASPEGLVRVPLAPDDVAHARRDLADLRIVDAEHRQWPYLVAPAVARTTVVLATGAREIPKDGVSRWPLVLPARPFLVDGLTLVPDRAVLDRAYRVVAAGADGKERVLASGALAQDLRRPEAEQVSFAAERVDRLAIEIDDGDDAPVVLARVETTLALPDLLIAAPAGRYALVAGNPDAAAPQYELARARATVLGLRSVAAAPGAAGENPSYDASVGPGVQARTRERLTRVAVGAVLLLAVIVLGVLTFRMVRGEVPPPAGE